MGYEVMRLWIKNICLLATDKTDEMGNNIEVRLYRLYRM